MICRCLLDETVLDKLNTDKKEIARISDKQARKTISLVSS